MNTLKLATYVCSLGTAFIERDHKFKGIENFIIYTSLDYVSLSIRVDSPKGSAITPIFYGIDND